MAPGALTISQMSDPEIHTCSADKVAPYWFKSFVCSWQKKWRNIWMLGGRRFVMRNVYWNIAIHCVTLRSKDTNDWQKIFHMWNMWKGIHSSFKPAQAYHHHHGEKPLFWPQLVLIVAPVSIGKTRDGAHWSNSWPNKKNDFQGGLSCLHYLS